MSTTPDSGDTAHVHTWTTDRQPCACGEPVPSWLIAAWDRYAERTKKP